MLNADGSAGPTVKAFLLAGVYEKGQRDSDAERKKLNLERRVVCPNWNYTIRPRSDVALDTWAKQLNREVVS